MTTAAIDWMKEGTGLVPAIVQHAATGAVLMLGWMNAEALAASEQTGFVTFFSRARQRLWKKGETSGNTLRLVSVAVDCDGDALLVRALPAGPTCHTGSATCFGNEESALEVVGALIETIRQRGQSASSESYTRRLLEKGVAAYGAKVMEEAEEVVRAARSEGKQRTIEEAADLLYHLLVLLRGEGIELEEVAGELRRRRPRPPEAAAPVTRP